MVDESLKEYLKQNLKDKLKIKELYILDGGIYKYATEIDPSMDV